MGEGPTDGESYTVQEAARILRTTERTVRRRLERGDLEGRRDPISGRWRVEAHSVTAAMSERPPKAPEKALEASESARDYQERVAKPSSASSDAWKALGNSRQ